MIWAVVIGGALGALSRFGTYGLIEHCFGNAFPWATFIVNCVGSFVAAFLIAFFTEAFGALSTVRLLLFTGFLGSYTTFSSFAVENVILLDHGLYLKFALNVIANNLVALSLAVLGFKLAKNLM